MTRTITSTQFADESPSIGTLEWEFDEHIAKHIAKMETPAVEALADTIHEHFESSLSMAVREVEKLIFDIPPGDNDETQGVSHIHIDIDDLGSIAWTPGDNLKFRLDALAMRDAVSYTRTILTITEFMISSMIAFISPLCGAAPIDEQCMLNILGVPISNN